VVVSSPDVPQPILQWRTMVHVPKGRTHASAVIVAAYNNVGHLRDGDTLDQLAIIWSISAGRRRGTLNNLLDTHTCTRAQLRTQYTCCLHSTFQAEMTEQHRQRFTARHFTRRWDMKISHSRESRMPRCSRRRRQCTTCRKSTAY